MRCAENSYDFRGTISTIAFPKMRGFHAKLLYLGTLGLFAGLVGVFIVGYQWLAQGELQELALLPAKLHSVEQHLLPSLQACEDSVCMITGISKVFDTYMHVMYRCRSGLRFHSLDGSPWAAVCRDRRPLRSKARHLSLLLKIYPLSLRSLSDPLNLTAWQHLQAAWRPSSSHVLPVNLTAVLLPLDTWQALLHLGRTYVSQLKGLDRQQVVDQVLAVSGQLRNHSSPSMALLAASTTNYTARLLHLMDTFKLIEVGLSTNLLMADLRMAWQRGHGALGYALGNWSALPATLPDAIDRLDEMWNSTFCHLEMTPYDNITLQAAVLQTHRLLPALGIMPELTSQYAQELEVTQTLLETMSSCSSDSRVARNLAVWRCAVRRIAAFQQLQQLMHCTNKAVERENMRMNMGMVGLMMYPYRILVDLLLEPLWLLGSAEQMSRCALWAMFLMLALYRFPSPFSINSVVKGVRWMLLDVDHLVCCLLLGHASRSMSVLHLFFMLYPAAKVMVLGTYLCHALVPAMRTVPAGTLRSYGGVFVIPLILLCWPSAVYGSAAVLDVYRTMNIVVVWIFAMLPAISHYLETDRPEVLGGGLLTRRVFQWTAVILFALSVHNPASQITPSLQWIEYLLAGQALFFACYRRLPLMGMFILLSLATQDLLLLLTALLLAVKDIAVGRVNCCNWVDSSGEYHEVKKAEQALQVQEGGVNAV